jgi:hypothetical protein
MWRARDRAKAYHSSLGLAVLALCSGCKEDVSLGSWLTAVQPTVQPAPAPTRTTPEPVVVTRDASVTPVGIIDAGTGAADDDGQGVAIEAGPAQPPVQPSPNPIVDARAPEDAGVSPVCAEVGEPEDLNRPGMGVGGTMTNTDWVWPQPLDSVEFDFASETEVGDDGYFWAYEFTFVAGIRGLLGMQGNGYYQAEPPAGDIEVTKMVQFWIQGALQAELGDVPFPDARVAQESSNGVPGFSIQTKFDWQPCHIYRFRLGLDGTDESGNRWYGASVADTTTGDSTYLGHMLAPLNWGRLSTTSTMWSERFTLAATLTCADVEYSSVLFGNPTGNAGTVEPLSHMNRFQVPPLCGSSRFTEFPNAIRHEVGVPMTP